MKTSFKLIALALILTLSASCKANKTNEAIVVFETNYGKITVKLYNETPLHKQNFLKLVDEGFYNGLLFHRVIADFMIQAGDPKSRNAKPGDMLGGGDVGYTIPAEFIYPQYYHKKGALAAARQGDNINPQRASSGCQFYFVVGRTFTDRQLQSLETRNKEKFLQKTYSDLLSKSEDYKKALAANDEATKNKFMEQAMEQAITITESSTQYLFSEEQKTHYKTIGGTPHLDGEYTVFGEVIDGLEIVENISKTKVGVADRPLEDVIILKAKRK